MPINPNIILQAGNFERPDFNKSLGTALGLIGARDDQAVRQQQMALNERQIAAADRAAASAEAKQGRMATIGGMAAQGDVAGAHRTALEAGDFDAYAEIAKLTDAQKKHLETKYDAAASVAAKATEYPLALRRSVIAAAAPMLKGAGWTDEELANIDPTDEFLAGTISSRQTVKDVLAQQQADRTFKAGREDAAATQGLTLRGQNITMRGQNMTDARSRDNNAIQMAGGMAPKEQRRMTIDLRSKFDALPEVKSFKEIAPVITSARRAPDNAAGDIQLAYTVGKILDPNSVVREGELAMAVRAGSPLERLFGAGTYTLGNGGRMTPAIRKELLGMLNERALANRQAYDAARENYEGYASEAGINPRSVVGTHVANAYAGAAPKPKAADVPSDIAAILTKHKGRK